MKITRNPLESHIYHVPEIGRLPLTEDAKAFFKWLEIQDRKHWQIVGHGMIRVAPPLETLFVLKWL